MSRYRVELVREAETANEVPPMCERPEAAVRFLHEVVAPFDREVVVAGRRAAAGRRHATTNTVAIAHAGSAGTTSTP